MAEVQTPFTYRANINKILTCPVNFPTRHISLEVTIPDNYWYGLDAVRTTGSLSLSSNVVTHPLGYVMYVPHQYYHGEDSFNYTVDDCPNYLIYRGLNAPSRTSTVCHVPIHMLHRLVPYSSSPNAVNTR